MAGERILPGLGLTGFWDAGSSGWNTGLDSNLLRLSVVANMVAKSRTSDLPGTGSSGDIYIVKATDPLHPGQIAAWDAGAWVYVPGIVGWAAYIVDEAQSFVFTAAGWRPVVLQVPFQIGSFFDGKPGPEDVLLRWLFAGAATFAVDFAGSRAVVDSSPEADWTAAIQLNGVTIGTLMFPAGLTVPVFETISATPVHCVAGDVLTVVAPTIDDQEMSGLVFTLAGTRE